MTAKFNIVSVCRTFPTPTDPSGGVFVLNRVAAMARQANVHAIQPLPFFPGVKPLPVWARQPSRVEAGLSIEHAPMFYLPGALKSLDAWWLARAIETRIARLHRDSPVDLIDAHFGYPEGAGCVEVGRRLGIPVVVTIRGFENEYIHRPFVGRRMINALRQAAGLVSVSESLRQVIAQQGINPDKIRVVWNAIDASLFAFGAQSEARARLAFPPGRPLIVSVGHLVSRKRHHVLIEAFARASTQLPDATLAIIGARSFESKYPDQLIAQAASSGVAGRVRFLGNLPQREVVDWLRAADLFALGTAREGCCNAVLEALAVGVPIVTTPAGDNAEFIRPPHNGLLVPVDDANALAAGLIDALLRKNWDRQGISRELHAKVGGWTDVARHVLEFFGSIHRSKHESSERLAAV